MKKKSIYYYEKKGLLLAFIFIIGVIAANIIFSYNFFTTKQSWGIIICVASLTVVVAVLNIYKQVSKLNNHKGNFNKHIH